MWPWKLIVGTPSRVAPESNFGYWGIANYSFIPGPAELTGTVYRLFNLETDETESTNVASQYPNYVKKLAARLEWWANPTNGYRPPQPNFPNPRANPKYFNWTYVPFLEEKTGL